MDNTLLDDHDPPRIKLCDFGFAKWWTQEPQMTTITGMVYVLSCTFMLHQCYK